MLKVTAAAGEKEMAVAEKWGSRALPLPKIEPLDRFSLLLTDSPLLAISSSLISGFPSEKRQLVSAIFFSSSLSRFARWLRPFNSSSFPSGVDAHDPRVVLAAPD